MQIIIELCGIGAVIFGVLATFFFSTNHRDAGIWASCAAVVLAIIVAFAYFQERVWRSDVEKAQQNVLIPGDGEMPELPRVQQPYADEIRDSRFFVFLGRAIVCVDHFPFAIIRQLDESMISLDREGHALALSAKFFNEAGKIVCEIVRNELHFNEKNIFRIERASPQQFSVLDDEARQVISVEYINARAVRIIGYFFLRNGLLVHISSDKLQIQVAGTTNSMSLLQPVAFMSRVDDFALGVAVAADRQLQVIVKRTIMPDPTLYA
jgi:hypothetical protein